MKQYRRFGLAGIVLAAALSGCATQIHGYIDASYVPERIDDHYEHDEIKVEVDVHSETPLGQSLELQVGGISRTYMNTQLPEDWTFRPNTQEWEAYIKLLCDNGLELYARHLCGHGMFENEERWVEDDNFIINHDSITEIGVRYSW